MANTTLILGESGTGKSTSIRNLNPAETVVLATLEKPLPFRNFENLYKGKDSVADGEKPNYLATSNYETLIKSIELISKTRDDIKVIVLDDWQYLMGFEFMDRAIEKGYGKFAEMGQHAFFVIRAMIAARPDLKCFVLSHSDRGEDGKMRCKTLGKMLDNNIDIPSLFTSVMHSVIVDEQYKFLTQGDSNFLAKTPMGMFEDKYIPNDLAYVVKKMDDYYSGEIKED